MGCEGMQEPTIWEYLGSLDWSFVATSATAITAILQLFVTYFIARSINKASELSESLQISRDITAIWQDYNKTVITDEEFRNTLRLIEKSNEDDDTTQMRHYIFYVLNIINTAWAAERTKRDHFDHSSTIVRDHLLVLRPQRELVESILLGGRGYNKHFVEDCVKILNEIKDEDDGEIADGEHSAGERQRLESDPEPKPSDI